MKMQRAEPQQLQRQKTATQAVQSKFASRRYSKETSLKYSQIELKDAVRVGTRELFRQNKMKREQSANHRDKAPRDIKKRQFSTSSLSTTKALPSSASITDVRLE